MSRADDSVYAERLYDLFQGDKDYAADVHALRQLVVDHRPKTATWLDVACGTGHHLAGLSRAFAVAGADISPAMLAVARRNVGPGVPLHECSFTTFDLAKTFDVVSCLSSSICHAETADGLLAAIARMGAHVRGDGLLLVERYFAPEQWDDSRVGVQHINERELTASQYHVSRREGVTADLHAHYVMAQPRRVEHHDQYFRVGLYTEHDYAAAFEAADLPHRTLRADILTGRGLYIASRAPLKT